MKRGLGYVNDILYEQAEQDAKDRELDNKNSQQDTAITQAEQKDYVQYGVQNVVLDQENTLTSNQIVVLWQWTPSILGGIPLAQTFTAAISGTVKKVELIWGTLSAEEYVTVSIQTTDLAGHPTGVILDSVNVPATQFVDGHNIVMFNDVANVVAGTKYAIVLDTSELRVPGGQTIFVIGANMGDADTVYPNGEALIYYNNQWTTLYNCTIPRDPAWAFDGWEHPYADWYFKVYVSTGALVQVDVIRSGFIKPKATLDTDAPVNSLYFSSDQNKLTYKDSLAVVKPIQDNTSPLAVVRMSGAAAPNETIFFDTDTIGPPMFGNEKGLTYKDAGGTTHIIAFA